MNFTAMQAAVRLLDRICVTSVVETAVPTNDRRSH